MSAVWSPQPILVIGASVRAACQSALRTSDRHIIAADLFCDRDLSSLVEASIVEDYPDGFLEVLREQCKKHPQLAVVYTGALENYPEIIAACEETAALLGTTSDVIQAVRDPFHLRQTLQEEEIEFPEVLHQFDAKMLKSRWLRKSFQSAGGQRVSVVDPNQPTRNVEQDAASYYQKFVNGVPCSAAFVCNTEGAQPIGISEMLVGCDWLGAKGFQYCGSIERRPADVEETSWDRLGRVLSRHYQLRGVFGVDAIVNAGRVYPIEVNPRFTASMELFDAPNLSVFDQHLQAFSPLSSLEPRSNLDRASDSNYAYRGKCILYAKRDTEFRDDLGALLTLEAELADVPKPQIIPAGYPMLTLLASDSSPQLLRQKLQAVAAYVYEILS